MDDPDMGTWTYTYDGVDNLTTQTDARGVVISFSYDVLNRLTQATGAYGTLTYSYDAEGRLSSVTSGGKTTSFTYEGDGGRVKVTDGPRTSRFRWPSKSLPCPSPQTSPAYLIHQRQAPRKKTS